MKISSLRIEIKGDTSKLEKSLIRFNIIMIPQRFNQMLPGLKFIPLYFKKIIMNCYKGGNNG